MEIEKEYFFETVSLLAERIFIQLVQSDDLVGEKERRGRDSEEIAEMAFNAAARFIAVKEKIKDELCQKKS